MLWGTWVLILVDEATRYKVAVATQGRDSQELMQKLLENWMRYFGPPASMIVDQEVSLMSHETAAEFERLSIERKPKGTTAGPAAAQHTGTGLVERHTGLLKLTMLKLKAELDRQGIICETAEIAMESAMAHNSTLNYGGVTPAMAVFGILPRGFYDDESPGLLSAAGALQSDLTTFEKAVRIRQMSLAAVQQAIVEDRTARAHRTRSHRLDTSALVPGTSEVEFYREVQGDVGWRGPALLLRIDPDEGVAIIQYQGRPYLVSIRHIRPHVQTFLNINDSLCLKESAEDELLDIMKATEMVPPFNKRFLGYLPEHKITGTTWRKIPSSDSFDTKIYKKLETISQSLTSRTLSGMIYGRSLKFIKPPANTTGYLITWSLGSVKYHLQEHWSSDPIKMKKISAEKQEDLCAIYMFHHVINQEETTQTDWKRSSTRVDAETTHDPQDQRQVASADQPMDDDVSMKDGETQPSLKREGPDTRTVVIAPEKKKMRLDYAESYVAYYNACSIYHLIDRRKKIKIEFRHGTQLWAENSLTEKLMTEASIHQEQCDSHQTHKHLFHIAASQNAALHVDLRTSEVWRVDVEHDDISEDDVYKIWPLVEETDQQEVAQFVQEKAFRKIHRDAFDEEMVIIDARWVRRWKKLSDGSKKVKSRLCARGCLDRQKDLLTTRSTTATRLSQRMLLSTAAVFDLEVESWDIAGAFLKGLNFHQIRKMLLKMGINTPVRTVVILPPLNVWRHLAAASSDFMVHDCTQYGLLCLKPVYGLNDAPLAWQLSLQEYLREIDGSPSVMDENSWRWKQPTGSILAVCTCHVDDMAIAAPQTWLDKHYDAFVKKFGKVTRQRMPFEHCGSKYEKLPDGYRMTQSDFCAKMTPAKIADGRKDNDRLSKEETTSYRSILGALLWLTATRLDLISDVSQLATFVTTAEIKHLRQANQVLKRAQDKDCKDVGLYFRKLDPRHGLRLACFHDSSSHTKEKSYAHEGVLILLMEDHVKPKDGLYEITCNDEEIKCHGGHAHILWSHGSKAKRISYSTSHAETLAAISGHEASVLVNVRLSEMLHKDKRPTLQQLAAIQEIGNPQLPIDDYGDCNDVYQLVTGSKTLPQDKQQRIYVLSLRESRLAGRIRWMSLIPTRSMAADALTKPMISPQMMELLTTGTLLVQNEDTHHLQMKRLPPKYEIDERDLDMDGATLIKQYDQDTKNANNLWWTPMFASFKRGAIPFLALLVLSGLPMASAEEHIKDHDQSDGTLFYAMIIFTLFVLVLERFVMHFGNRISGWMISTSHQSSSPMPSSTTRPMVRTTASERSCMVQTDEIKNPNRLWTEDTASAGEPPDFQRRDLEVKCQQLEKELKQAMNEITKLQQLNQKNTQNYMTKTREMQRKIDLLQNRVEATNAPKLNNEHIPDTLLYTAHGECFHQMNCPTISQPTMRPFKLAKCKRCF